MGQPLMLRTSTKGMTLIETVTAVIVLGTAIPPLTKLYTEISSHRVDHAYQEMAVIYADSLLEEIVSKSFEDPDLAVGSFGTEEQARKDYDDLDDFDGLSNSPPQHFDGTPLNQFSGFTRSTVVDNVTASDPDPASAETDGTTDFKRIAVSVTWTSGRGGQVTLSTLRTQLVSPPDQTGPLDVIASAATVKRKGHNKFELDLVSISANDVEIQSFDLSSDDTNHKARELKLEHKKIWHEHNGKSIPTGLTQLNQGHGHDRIIKAGKSPELEFRSQTNLSETIAYTLILYFTDGSSSTLNFSVEWDD
jgi:MSHA pilin protein MshD